MPEVGADGAVAARAGLPGQVAPEDAGRAAAASTEAVAGQPGRGGAPVGVRKETAVERAALKTPHTLFDKTRFLSKAKIFERKKG